MFSVIQLCLTPCYPMGYSPQGWLQPSLLLAPTVPWSCSLWNLQGVHQYSPTVAPHLDTEKLPVPILLALSG